jgi:hypothetical protein
MQAWHALWIATAMACSLGDASAEAIRCDSCRPATMHRAARNAGAGTHHVYSLHGNAIRSYRVEVSGGITTSVSIPTPRDIALCTSGLQEIHILSNGTMKVAIQVPYESLRMASHGESAATDPEPSPLLRDVLLPARLASGDIPSASAGINALLVHVRTLAGLRQGTEITWNVMFPNGATLTYDHQLR